MFSILRRAVANGASSMQRLLLLHDSGDFFAAKARLSILRAIEYSRLEFDEADLETLGRLPDLDRYSCVVMCAERLQLLNVYNCEALVRYASGGGGIACLYRGWNPALSMLFGVSDTRLWLEVTEDETGLRFPDGSLPGFEGVSLDGTSIAGHTAFDVEPLSSSRVVARFCSGRAACWLNTFGAGRVVYWNTVVLGEKLGRGLVVQSIALVQRVAVLPIANVAVLQVDDLPPMDLEGALEPIASEFEGMTCTTFYDTVWLPDIVELSRRFELTWTFFPVFNYHGLAEPPFSCDSWRHPVVDGEGYSSHYRTRLSKAVSQHGELGLHGYDHLQLVSELWASQDYIQMGLRAAMDEWKASDLGPLPRCYVPPNNEIDAQGIAALTAALPSIETISGLYFSGAFDRGGNREFGPEPWDPRLFSLPRATGGYIMNELAHFAAVSELSTFGVWTHFIHPDDVYDTEANRLSSSDMRNGENRFWRAQSPSGLESFRDGLERWLTTIRSLAPSLRFMTTTDGAAHIRRHLATDVRVEFLANKVVIDCPSGTWLRVRLNNGVQLNPAGLRGAELFDVQPAGDDVLFTLCTTARMVEFETL